MSVGGLVGTLPFVASYALDFFDVGPDLQLLAIPLAVQEMVMGLWLIIKGFDQNAIKELEGAPPLAP